MVRFEFSVKPADSTSMRILILVVGMIFTLASSSSRGSQVFLLENDDNPFRNIHSYKYLIDPTGELSAPAVLKMDFPHVANGMKSIGRQADPIWMRFEIKNTHKSSTQWFLYSLGNFLHEEVDFYIRDSKGLRYLGSAGSEILKEDRPLTYHFIGTKFDLEANAAATILIRFSSRFNISNDFIFATRDAYSRSVMINWSILGIFLGIVLMVSAFSFIYFLLLRERDFLFFGPSCLANAIAILTFGGLWDLFRFPSWPSGSMVLFPFWFILAIADGLLSFSLLEMKKRAPKLRIAFIASWLLFPMIVILRETQTGFWLMSKLIDLLIIFRLVFFIWTVAAYARQGFRPAYYWIMASLSSVIATTLWLFVGWDLIPATPATAILPLAGSTLMVAIRSFAMIDRMQEINRKRIYAEEEARQSDELKTLVRVMSHDLLNPLAIVLTTAKNSIEATDTPEQNQKNWRRVERAAMAQSAIIKNVRLLRALDDGKLKALATPVHVDDVLADALFVLDDLLTEKNISCSIHYHALNPPVVLADKVALTHHILGNIISNAIKFSQRGDVIEIEVDTRSEVATISVKDKGIGIPPDMLPDIFSRTKETSRQGTGGEQGTGFGMPLVKAYIETFGGHIQVESRSIQDFPDSSGTTVTVTFPKSVA